MRPRLAALPLAAALAASAVGCSGHGTKPSSAPASATAPFVTATQATAPAEHGGGTVWLCRPDQVPNPCTSNLAATAIAAAGSHTTLPVQPPGKRSADCFYVYPTVSREKSRNADLRVQQAERDVAVTQAARFSSVCRVWAPMYRQRTVSDLFNLADLAPDSAANAVAYTSLRNAWRDYITHHNHGRPIVFI